MREITYSEALNEALREEMERDESVFNMGCDIGLLDGTFKVTKGLLRDFGSDRVMETPLAEGGFAGVGVGAAITGSRPVVEVMGIDWITLMMDQLVNQAAKLRYMTGGQISVPLVVRAAAGGRSGVAAQHSQSLEAWFCHIPGLKVVMPSTPADAKGLLKASIREDNPVIFVEPRALYATKGLVPDSEYIVPLGQADIKRSGGDVTVVATGATVRLALNVAIELAPFGIDIEVVDPRTLRPLDVETILSSVKKTHRLVVVNEANSMCSFADAVAAIVADQGFDYLDAPIKRVTGADTPVPYSAALELAVSVSEASLARTIREVVGSALTL